MTEERNFRTHLISLIQQVYPDADCETLADAVVAAFWPDGTGPCDHGRMPSNDLWTEQDALLITYGNSIIDGAHKPLDLLHDFLLRRMKGAVNGVHILPFFPYTSDDGFAVSDFRAVNPQLGDWPDINRISEDFDLMSDLVLNHVSSQGQWFNSYRQGQAPYDKYFFEASPQDALNSVVRPRTTPLLQEVDTVMRLLCDFASEKIILLTETNVPKAENLSYFGNHDEAHAIYNFPLPPLVLHAVMSGSAHYLRRWQSGMPPAPMGCAYLNFTASHDGIGMRPVEGILPGDEQARMIDTIKDIGGLVSMRALPDGGEAPYEINTTYFEATAQTFASADDHHFDRFVCTQTIPMSLEGIPAFYIHSMLGTANDHAQVAHRGMNRAINRHRWDYPELNRRLDDPSSTQAKVLAALSDRLRIRAKQPAFHPNATQFTMPLEPWRLHSYPQGMKGLPRAHGSTWE